MSDRQSGRYRLVDWRETCLGASIVSGLVLVVVTESLSVLGRVSTWEVRGTWLLWLVIGVGILRPRVRGLSRLGLVRPCLPAASRVVIGALVVLALLEVVTVVFAPPNAVDALNYHLSRVANWQQRQSVGPYPAGYLPQLYQPPWAEFAMLYLQVGVGSDRLAGGVQWLCWVGSLVLVSLLARYLGASGRGQVLAAAFAGSIPTGIVEASGALNDCVATFWLTAWVTAVIGIWRQPERRSAVAFAMAGAALGLAILTKGTNYIYAAGFGLLFVAVTIGIGRHRRFVAHLAAAGSLLILVNAGYYLRNYELFGSPLGPGFDELNGSSYFVDAVTWNGFVSNVARNLALEIATPSPTLNRAVFSQLKKFHDWLGVSPDDAATTWNGASFGPARLSFHETTTGNLVSVVWLLLTLMVALISRQLMRDGRLAVYICVWAAGLMLFCLLLKWQPWNTRLHLSWLVLGAPIIGVVWTRRLGRLAWLVLGLFIAAVTVRAVADSGQVSARRAGLVLAAGVLLAAATWLASRLPPRAGRMWQRAQVAKRLGSWVVRWCVCRTRASGEALLGLTLLGLGVPWLVWNETRPLAGSDSVVRQARVHQYFANVPELEAPYVWAADRIQQAGCTRVGLLAGPGSIDYPLWVLLRERSPGMRIEDVQVPNVSARLESPDFRPCAVLALEPMTRRLDAVVAIFDDVQFARVVASDRPDVDMSLVALFLQAY